MHDEDSADATACPHCGSTDSCAHLLGVLDLTHGTCEGGYLFKRIRALEAMVVETLDRAKASKRRDEIVWTNQDVAELWTHALENDGGPGSEVALDRDVVMRLICAALDGAGAEQVTGAVGDGEGPGNESAMEIYFAEDPEAAFLATMDAVSAALAPNFRRKRVRPQGGVRALRKPRPQRKAAPRRAPKRRGGPTKKR